jgi:hypothetical protein
MAGTVVANVLNTDTGLFQTNNAYNGIAKAWVNFNGLSGSVAIRASFNVSSITRNGTGDYTISFTTSMPDANYSVSGTCNPNITGSSGRFISAPYATAPTTTAIRVSTCDAVNTNEDQQYVYVAINGN